MYSIFHEYKQKTQQWNLNLQLNWLNLYRILEFNVLTRTSTEQPTVHDGFPKTWFWHRRWTKDDFPTPGNDKNHIEIE